MSREPTLYQRHALYDEVWKEPLLTVSDRTDETHWIKHSPRTRTGGPFPQGLSSLRLAKALVTLRHT